jgi:SAM-dependent methyltransferase
VKPDDVRKTYGPGYATVYDDTFLLSDWNLPSLRFQLDLIRRHLPSAGEWLDVACGTGYVLSQFPGVRRTGLDLSPSMLAIARERNPDASFVQQDFRQEVPGWEGRFDLVTSMWWAYCLVDSMAEVRRLAAQLADWTSPDGAVLLPLLNVNKLDAHNIKVPYIDPKVPGRCMLTGVIWAWIQEDGSRHDDLIAPQVEHLHAMFLQHFAEVTIVEADLEQVGEGWRCQDVLVARRKRKQALVGDLHPAGDGPRPGVLEWHLGVNGEARAGLRYPEFTNLSAVAITIHSTTGAEPWEVQASKSGYAIAEGSTYRVAFRARADCARPIQVGMGRSGPPWTGLGLYQRFQIDEQWGDFVAEFTATATEPRARLHFDVGERTGTVELSTVRLDIHPTF